MKESQVKALALRRHRQGMVSPNLRCQQDLCIGFSGLTGQVGCNTAGASGGTMDREILPIDCIMHIRQDRQGAHALIKVIRSGIRMAHGVAHHKADAKGETLPGCSFGSMGQVAMLRCNLSLRTIPSTSGIG